MQSKIKPQLQLMELIEQATKYIISQGYSKSAINQHTFIWKQLLSFANLHDHKFFSLKLAAEFMKETYDINNIFKPNSKTERWRVRYVWCLNDFSKEKSFVSHREYNIAPIPEVFKEVNSLYKTYLLKKNQKTRSISTKLARIKIFFLFLHSHNLLDTKQLTPTNIIEFMESLEYSNAYRSNVLFTLRDFLKCPIISEQFQEGLVNVLNPINFNRYEKLPSFYSDEEISKTLLAIDRSIPEGKKDYAIIILAVELALRVSDIRNLQLNEIKWDKNVIELFQQKTGEFLRLYMTDNVKWALLDYLMNVRPQNSKYNYVFLRLRAPYTPYCASASFYKRINKYISLANIKTEGKHHGLHSYRYSLATRLMDEGVPFTVISEVLGHKLFNVTKDYIGIDISRLRLVALEVPFNE